MRIRPECVKDYDEDEDCTTRLEPIRELFFYPRPHGCGYRYRREPFTPKKPVYAQNEWPFFRFDEPDNLPETVELRIYDVDPDINPRHDRRLGAAQDLGEAIVSAWDSLPDAETTL